MVKPGYKETEIGLLPEDWSFDKISNHALISTGSRNTEDRKDDGQYPFFVRSQKVENIDTYSYDGEAVLTAGDGVGTGKVIHYINGKFDFHQRVYKISDFLSDLDGYYFFKIFSARFYDRIMSMTAKSSVDSVRMEMIADMLIPLPDLTEQRYIGEALSNVDSLISWLDKLIIKKQNIKTATMQHLLTGKDRLPGFNNEWIEVTLEDLCTEINDGTHHTPNYVNYGIPFYSVETVTENNFLNTKHISLEEHRRLIQRCKPEKGDILMTRIGTLGVTKLIDWDVNASIYVSLALLKLKKNISAEYIYRYTKSDYFIEAVEQRSLLHATPKKINLDQIGGVPIKMPIDKKEQNAIGKILSDMDKEIVKLDIQYKKIQDIRLGMMQELLSGRTRLS